MADKIVSWGGIDSKGTSGMGVTGSLTVSGNVGIGTSTPARTLEVNGTIGTTADGVGRGITMGTAVAGASSYFNVGQGTGWLFHLTTNNATYTANSTRMTITDNGVGFGNFVANGGTVSATAQVRGSGTTSSTTALLVQNANASASLSVKDDGTVGIGTTSPSYKTQISLAGGSSTAISTIASTNYNLVVQNTTDVAGTYAGVGFMNPFDTQGYIGVSQVGTGYGAGGNMLFALRPQGGGTVMTEYMRLLSNGNLLLGTTTDSGYKLDVNGSTVVRGTGNALTVLDTSGTGRNFTFNPSYATSTYGGFFNHSTGNITLGASLGTDNGSSIGIILGAPSGTRTALLQVKGTGTTSSTTALLIQNANASASLSVRDDGVVLVGSNIGLPASSYVYWGDANSSVQHTGTAMNFRVYQDNQPWQFITANNGSVQAKIDTGYVRVKTGFSAISNSPVTMSGWDGGAGSAGNILLVKGGNSGTSPQYAGGNGADLIFENGLATDNSLGFGGTPGSIIFKYGTYNNTASVEYGRLNSSGNLLIGTTAGSAKLLISGSSNSALFEVDSPALNNILYVTGSGRVGIGTSSPLASLHVAGNTIITGSLTVSSTTAGSTENTLTLGPAPGGGTGEGGQLGLNSTGGSYLSASFIDVYQDQFRILKGTNAGSISGLMVINMPTNQTQFLGPVTASAYSGLPNDYLYATRSGSNQTVGSAWANTDIIFNNVVVSKGISFNTSTGVASLTGGKVYRVTARLAWSAAAAYNLQFSCYTSANTKIGPDVEIVQSANGTFNISDGTLEFIYAPSGNTDIKIRCTGNNTALSGEQIRYDLNTQFIIQQIA